MFSVCVFMCMWTSLWHQYEESTSTTHTAINIIDTLKVIYVIFLFLFICFFLISLCLYCPPSTIKIIIIIVFIDIIICYLNIRTFVQPPHRATANIIIVGCAMCFCTRNAERLVAEKKTNQLLMTTCWVLRSVPCWLLLERTKYDTPR